jgi:aryl-alcohol dehydrogenase-like predicted oxidoreductase
LDLGINFFDTANSYGDRANFDRPGIPPAAERESAEALLGNALRGKRNEVILATKVQERVLTGPNGGGPDGGGLSRVHIMQMLERSLQRLQTDYIDVYYAHHPDPTTPIDQTLRAIEDLIRQGKIRYFALSQFSAWQTVESVLTAGKLGAYEPVVNQVSYSMTVRGVEKEVIPACLQYGLGITAFSPLNGGLLAGSKAANRPYSGNQRWRGSAEPAFSQEQLRVAEELDRLGDEWGHRPSQLALAWLLTRPAVVSAIVGPGRLETLEESANATAINLSPEQLEKLDSLQ